MVRHAPLRVGNIPQSASRVGNQSYTGRTTDEEKMVKMPF